MYSDHPRIRGEHGIRAAAGLTRGGSSPHTRGALDSETFEFGGIPDHPRIRGEHRAHRPGHPVGDGSSPHTRGARVGKLGLGVPGGIIPAYAGSTRALRIDSRGSGDHPRIRGEHHPDLQGGVTWIGIIPAYAGSTANTSRTRRGAPDHPRIRGEHFQTFMADIADRGSSPHTRGAHERRGGFYHAHRIIPAYAGSTTARSISPTSPRDHPRIRGEHH